MLILLNTHSRRRATKHRERNFCHVFKLLVQRALDAAILQTIATSSCYTHSLSSQVHAHSVDFHDEGRFDDDPIGLAEVLFILTSSVLDLLITRGSLHGSGRHGNLVHVLEPARPLVKILFFLESEYPSVVQFDRARLRYLCVVDHE